MKPGSHGESSGQKKNFLVFFGRLIFFVEKKK